MSAQDTPSPPPLPPNGKLPPSGGKVQAALLAVGVGFVFGLTRFLIS